MINRLVIGLAMSCLASLSCAQETYTVAYNEITAPIIPIVKAMYLEIGINPQFKLVPPERGIVSTNSGLFDADMSRVREVIQDFPNLISTHEPLRTAELYAYVKKGSSITLSEPDSLKQYTVGFIRGSKFIEAFLRKNELHAESAKSVESFYKMLSAGRFDIALITNTQLMLQTNKITEVGQRVGPVLATSPSFHILNKKHADLIPKLDAALKAMRDDGRLEKLATAADAI